jgi:predicted nucleic acid-binding protein
MFWDSSAMVPVVFPEKRSEEMVRLAARDGVVIWWGTPVECHAAAFRRHREGKATLQDVRAGLKRLRDLVGEAASVNPNDAVRSRAEQLTAQYPLRAADALQLAAALTWCEEEPWNETFVCLDRRLREAARQAGFAVLPAEE